MQPPAVLPSVVMLPVRQSTSAFLRSNWLRSSNSRLTSRKHKKKIIVRLEEQLALNHRQIRAALEVLGEANVPIELLATKLVEVAERFKTLHIVTSTQSDDNPAIAELKRKAQQAIETGKLAEADELLAKVGLEQRRAVGHLAVMAAETLRQRGEIARTRLRYREAAEHYKAAAATLPDTKETEDMRISYTLNAVDFAWIARF